MARRKRDSALDGAFNLFGLIPIWAGPIIALAGFAVVRYILPILMTPPKQGPDVSIILRRAMPMLSWFVLAAILLAWIMAECSKLKNRHLLDRQTGINSVRNLSSQDFEHLVAEYYRRRGYLAEVIGTNGNDGGVDIVLNGHGEGVLVQCKKRKAYKVGVQPARALLGVVVSQRASRGILVTSGRITNEARTFAAQNRTIELVDGTQLERMISSVRSSGISPSPSRPSPPPLATKPASPLCPSCGAGMLLRTARRGTSAGSQFRGCTTYPRCKGTFALAAESRQTAV